MAKFYGSVRGQRGEAHRLGYRSVVTYAASWHGAVRVEMHEDSNGTVRVEITTEPWEGEGRRNVVFSGLLAEAQGHKVAAAA